MAQTTKEDMKEKVQRVFHNINFNIQRILVCQNGGNFSIYDIFVFLKVTALSHSYALLDHPVCEKFIDFSSKIQSSSTNSHWRLYQFEHQNYLLETFQRYFLSLRLKTNSLKRFFRLNWVTRQDQMGSVLTSSKKLLLW